MLNIDLVLVTPDEMDYGMFLSFKGMTKAQVELHFMLYIDVHMSYYRGKS